MSNVNTVYKIFREAGLSPVQAAGLVGRMQQESGPKLNPQAFGDRTIPGGSVGIGQWNRERKANLMAHGGDNWQTPEAQAYFALNELGIGKEGGPGFGSEARAGRMLRDAKTIEEASIAAMGYERPQGWTSQNPTAGHGYRNTVNNAQALFDQFGDGPLPAAASPNPITDYSISPQEATAAAEGRAMAAQDMSNPISGYGGGPQAPAGGGETMFAGIKSPIPEGGIFGLRGKQKGEKETWRDKLAAGIADLGSFAAVGGAVPQMKSTPQIQQGLTPTMAQAPIDPNSANNQRQQLAMALSRLNSGKTFVG